MELNKVICKGLLPTLRGRGRIIRTLQSSGGSKLLRSFSSGINYDDYLNSKCKKRKPSLIRELTKRLVTAGPGTIFMAGGLPNPDLFPFQKLVVTLDDGMTLSLEDAGLREALQYQQTNGYPPLLVELKRLVKHFFNPPRMDESELIVTVGSQNALSTVLEMTLSPGDPVIIPQPIYSSALNIMDPLLPHYVVVPEDEGGMQPEILEKILNDWSSNNGAKRPKILYVNPTGCNPSGSIISTKRKMEIYEIARKHDLLILEDDPYYFLHFEEKDPVSFLSMDVDGRVIRFDSFSKIFSSGLRIGFATGHANIIKFVELSLQSSLLHASSLSQVLVHGVLSKIGISGFIHHTTKVKDFYKRRRDLILSSAEKHLTGLAEWETPKGGMFLWIKVLGIEDTFGMLMDRGLEQKIMMMPGREFMANRGENCPYLRAAFSVVPESQMDENKKAREGNVPWKFSKN